MAKSWFRDIPFLKFSLFYWHMVVLISISLPENLLLHPYKVIKILASGIQPGSEQKGCWYLNNNSKSPTSSIREAKGKRIYFYLVSTGWVQHQFLSCDGVLNSDNKNNIFGQLFSPPPFSFLYFPLCGL